jgi:hypothetical protein
MVMVRLNQELREELKTDTPRIRVIAVMWRDDSRQGLCFLVDINNIKGVL